MFSIKQSPNQSPSPTAVGAFRSAVAVHATSRRWLGFYSVAHFFRVKQLLTIPLLVLLAGCVSPCNSYPWTVYLLAPIVVFDSHTYRGHDGSSLRNAIILNGTQEDEASRKAEFAYIQHKFKVDTTVPIQQRRELGVGQHKYDVITFTTEKGKAKSLWFEVTAS